MRPSCHHGKHARIPASRHFGAQHGPAAIRRYPRNVDEPALRLRPPFETQVEVANLSVRLKELAARAKTSRRQRCASGQGDPIAPGWRQRPGADAIRCVRTQRRKAHSVPGRRTGFLVREGCAFPRSSQRTRHAARFRGVGGSELARSLAGISGGCRPSHQPPLRALVRSGAFVRVRKARAFECRFDALMRTNPRIGRSRSVAR